MSENDNKSTSGDNSDTSGSGNTTDQGTKDTSGSEGDKRFQKLLNEKKNTVTAKDEALRSKATSDAENVELKDKIKQMEEAGLKEKEDYKTLAEMKSEENKTLKSELALKTENETTAIKNAAIMVELEKFGFNREHSQTVLKLIDLSGVIYDKDLKTTHGAAEAVKAFRDSPNGKLGFFGTKQNVRVNQNAGDGNVGGTENEQYKETLAKCKTQAELDAAFAKKAQERVM